MPACVYCLDIKPDDSFAKVEHVLPQSFGRFEHNFTLQGILCDACNQYFGDQLEIALARDTFEGYSRFAFGVKNPQEFRPFGRGSRIVIKVMEGPFEGAYAYREYSAKAGEVLLRLLPQVGFLINDSVKYEFFLLDDLPTERQLRDKGFNSHHERAICGIAVDEAVLWDKLAEKGIPFRYSGAAVPPEQSQRLLCELEGTIDQKYSGQLQRLLSTILPIGKGLSLLLNHNSTRRGAMYGMARCRGMA